MRVCLWTVRSAAHPIADQRAELIPRWAVPWIVLDDDRRPNDSSMASSDDEDDFGPLPCAAAHPPGTACTCRLVEHETLVFNEYHGGKVGNAMKSDPSLTSGHRVTHCLPAALWTQTLPRSSQAILVNCCPGQLAIRGGGGGLGPPAVAPAALYE